MKKRYKNYLLIVMMFLIWIVAFIITLWAKGYKPLQYPTYSEKEKIEIAVQTALWKLKAMPPNVVKRFNDEKKWDDFFVPAYPIYYKDVAHFMSENPDCCRITRDQWVEVSGKVYYKDKNGDVHFSNRELLFQPLSSLLWEKK